MGLTYRAGQFWRLLRAPALDAGAWEEIAAVLNSGELALFRRFSNGDQQHGYQVMRTLLAAGDEHPALLAAALLHDVGKTQLSIRIWERVLGSLGEIFFPARAARWGRGQPRGWRRPFVIRQQHATWSAEMAAAAGSAPLAVALMRHHQDKELSRLDGKLAALLRRLQWADDQH
jgi:hypothetical protein